MPDQNNSDAKGKLSIALTTLWVSLSKITSNPDVPSILTSKELHDLLDAGKIPCDFSGQPLPVGKKWLIVFRKDVGDMIVTIDQGRLKESEESISELVKQTEGYIAKINNSVEKLKSGACFVEGLTDAAVVGDQFIKAAAGLKP